MKYYSLKYRSKLLYCLLIVLISSCNLDIQEEYDFEPLVDPVPSFDNLTAWDFIQRQQTTADRETLENEKMDFLKDAIELTGLQSEYSFSGTDRTYLLLNNRAFTEGGEIMQEITGDRTASIDEIDTPEEIEKLRSILRYHVIQAYVDQPTLFDTDLPYFYQTLIEGQDGEIILRRDGRWRIFVNDFDDLLPRSAKDTRVREHNLVFSNGIGHVLRDFVRR